MKDWMAGRDSMAKVEVEKKGELRLESKGTLKYSAWGVWNVL